jgi:HEAT repeat protein
MPPASQLSPELTRSLLQLARALLAATRNWMLYPPEHPAIDSSVARLRDAIRESSSGAPFLIGITPETLLIEGIAADAPQSAIAEVAAFLHDRDLLALTFAGDVPSKAIRGLLRVLSLEPDERRQRGGPAQVWQTDGHPSIVLEQIDYEKVLARDEGRVPEPAKRDDLWRSIVVAIAGGHGPALDERTQQRLLAIADSPVDIGALAGAVLAPKHTVDGSPMITSQAAAVLAAFRHLSSIVGVMAPERLPAVMNNLAAAAVQLDPHVMMQVMQAEDSSPSGIAVVKGLAGAFDDAKVAQLLATALAIDGTASDRLATIFNTIAPDEDRKRRVLTLTRSMLRETDFGKSGQFHALWTSMEALLVSYDDKPFVSDSYRSALDGVAVRADRMASADLPPELPEWIETLGQRSVRSLSVIMLIDLLTIEPDPDRVRQIADDMETLAEDLVMAGAYNDALMVTATLAERAATSGSVGREACRQALNQLGESPAMRETAALIGDVDADLWPSLQAMIRAIGPSSVESLKPVLVSEHDTVATARAEDLIVEFKNAAATRLASLAADPRWFVQRRAARLLGRIGAAEAVPLLQPLLRGGDARVAREAISALSAIPDPSASRAMQTVLRASTGEVRRAVIDVMAAERDPRVVPMLVRIIEESNQLGTDHEVVIEMIRALGRVGSEEAVPALVGVARRRAWFGRRKLRALKEGSIEALLQVGGPRADTAIREVSLSGDRMLRQIVAKRRGGKA